MFFLNYKNLVRVIINKYYNLLMGIYIFFADLNFDLKTSPTGQNQNIFSQPRASTRPAAATNSQHSSSFSSRTSFVSPHQSPVSEQTPSTPATHQPPSSVPHTISNCTSDQQQNEPPISQRHRNSNASSADPHSPISPAFSLASSSSAADTSSGGNRGRRTAAGSSHREHRLSTGELPTVHQNTTAAATTAIPSVKSRASCLTQRNYLELNGSAGSVSGCDCSDDEVITKFHRAYSKTTTPTSPEVKVLINDGTHESEPSGAVPKTAKESIDSGSDASSFEELGATGGASGTTVAPSTDTDTSWQIVNKSTLTDSPPPQPTPPSTSGTDMTVAQFSGQPFFAGRSQINLSNSTFHPQHSNESVSLLHAARRLTRRRSDTAVYESSSGLASRPRYNRSDYYHDVDDEYDDEDNGGGHRADMSRKRTKTSCDKCGKSKGNLRRHVAKFKRQLETTNATEVEIKLQLDAFLVYLETCNKNSMDLSDSEGAGGSVEGDSRDDVTLTNNQNFVDDDDIGIDDDVDDYDDDHFIFGDDEGIHVYGTDDTSGGSCGPPRQFINLTDYPDRY